MYTNVFTKLSIISLFVLFLAFFSFSADNKSNGNLLQLTIEQLAKYNGKDGNPAYVAIDSVIYDVSKETSWKNGEHKMGLKAGKDLSEQIKKSPHGKKVLKKLPVVGKLIPSPKQDGSVPVSSSSQSVPVSSSSQSVPASK